MTKRVILTRYSAQFLLTFMTGSTVYAAMPAGLPIEPAMSEAEMNAELPPLSPSGTSRAARNSGSRNTAAYSAEPRGSESKGGAFERRGDAGPLSDGEGEFGVALGLTMVQEGFGGQIKFTEYPRAWLAMSQTFRIFKNDEADALHKQRQAFLLGFEMHPWRKNFVSPFFNTQAGWERFYREDLPTLDSSVLEASAGLELRLGRLASVVGQWSESYYPGLKENLFSLQDKDPKRRAVAEVMFNLRWEGNF